MQLLKRDRFFSYYLPHKELSTYISYYSIQHMDFSSISPLFIPDLGGSIIVNQFRNDLDMTVWGPFNRITRTENRQRDVFRRYFIEFLPGGLSRLVYRNNHELLNRKIFLDEVDKLLYHALRQIFERHMDTADELISALDYYFLDLLDKRKDTLSTGRSVLSLFQNSGISTSVNELSADSNYSTRQINRYLYAFVGVSGKTYLRIKRFKKATEMLKRTHLSIEEIAYRLGYFDASHFVHDFSELSTLSPTLYRKNKSDFYNDRLKKI
ncbi:MAG TPA: helix-turn-helix transcriptional regulator [Thermotogota bacterium]|nr:helix-turn-helix transcriptional regulator [Thermotogota bacterium]HPJ89914.1 helix-turn-helix transcriptional regulator [Thermotogota bacterium]HPR96544.1 helix-turn-helix transcriptional regulator [Thermotogota bacterium]